jgi:NitT/TauT family transport system substrate-binding protein
MNLKKFLSVVLALAVFAGCAAACGQKQTDDAQLVKLTVSEVTHSIFYAPMYAAINNGYFKDAGIEIELINAGGADKVMTALLTGGADIGFAGPEASIYIYNEGSSDYAQVFAQVTKRDGSFLISRESGDFKWEDLKGKHILPGRKGGVPYMTLQYVLRKHGINTETDLNFDNSISFDAMTSAFVSGTGDYVTVFEPTATTLELEGRGHIVASVGEATEEIPFTAYFAKKSYIEKNPEIIQKFVNALYKGQ